MYEGILFLERSAIYYSCFIYPACFMLGRTKIENPYHRPDKLYILVYRRYLCSDSVRSWRRLSITCELTVANKGTRVEANRFYERTRVSNSALNITLYVL